MGRVRKARPILIAAISKTLQLCRVLKVAASMRHTMSIPHIQIREVPS